MLAPVFLSFVLCLLLVQYCTVSMEHKTMTHSFFTQYYLYSVLLGELLQVYHIVLSNSITHTRIANW